MFDFIIQFVFFLNFLEDFTSSSRYTCREKFFLFNLLYSLIATITLYFHATYQYFPTYAPHYHHHPRTEKTSKAWFVWGANPSKKEKGGGEEGTTLPSSASHFFSWEKKLKSARRQMLTINHHFLWELYDELRWREEVFWSITQHRYICMGCSITELWRF